MSDPSPDRPAPHACAWWQTYFFDNALRRLFYKPEELFAPYVQPGMTAADIGCGRGYNTLGLAQLVGQSGRVLASDVSGKVVELAAARLERAGLADRVQFFVCMPDRISLQGPVDFACLFWVLHEMPDPESALREIFDLLAPGGTLLVAEPKGHVSQEQFDQSLGQMLQIGFDASQAMLLRFSRVALARR